MGSTPESDALASPSSCLSDSNAEPKTAVITSEIDGPSSPRFSDTSQHQQQQQQNLLEIQISSNKSSHPSNSTVTRQPVIQNVGQITQLRKEVNQAIQNKKQTAMLATLRSNRLLDVLRVFNTQDAINKINNAENNYQQKINQLNLTIQNMKQKEYEFEQVNAERFNLIETNQDLEREVADLKKQLTSNQANTDLQLEIKDLKNQLSFKDKQHRETTLDLQVQYDLAVVKRKTEEERSQKLAAEIEKLTEENLKLKDNKSILSKTIDTQRELINELKENIDNINQERNDRREKNRTSTRDLSPRSKKYYEDQNRQSSSDRRRSYESEDRDSRKSKIRHDSGASSRKNSPEDRGRRSRRSDGRDDRSESARKSRVRDRRDDSRSRSPERSHKRGRSNEPDSRSKSRKSAPRKSRARQSSRRNSKEDESSSESSRKPDKSSGRKSTRRETIEKPRSEAEKPRKSSRRESTEEFSSATEDSRKLVRKSSRRDSTKEAGDDSKKSNNQPIRHSTRRDTATEKPRQIPDSPKTQRKNIDARLQVIEKELEKSRDNEKSPSPEKPQPPPPQVKFDADLNLEPTQSALQAELNPNDPEAQQILNMAKQASQGPISNPFAAMLPPPVVTPMAHMEIPPEISQMAQNVAWQSLAQQPNLTQPPVSAHPSQIQVPTARKNVWADLAKNSISYQPPPMTQLPSQCPPMYQETSPNEITQPPAEPFFPQNGAQTTSTANFGPTPPPSNFTDSYSNPNPTNPVPNLQTQPALKPTLHFQNPNHTGFIDHESQPGPPPNNPTPEKSTYRNPRNSMSLSRFTLPNFKDPGMSSKDRFNSRFSIARTPNSNFTPLHFENSGPRKSTRASVRREPIENPEIQSPHSSARNNPSKPENASSKNSSTPQNKPTVSSDRLKEIQNYKIPFTNDANKTQNDTAICDPSQKEPSQEIQKPAESSQNKDKSTPKPTESAPKSTKPTSKPTEATPNSTKPTSKPPAKPTQKPTESTKTPKSPSSEPQNLPTQVLNPPKRSEKAKQFLKNLKRKHSELNENSSKTSTKTDNKKPPVERQKSAEVSVNLDSLDGPKFIRTVDEVPTGSDLTTTKLTTDVAASKEKTLTNLALPPEQKKMRLKTPENQNMVDKLSPVRKVTLNKLPTQSEELLKKARNLIFSVDNSENSENSDAKPSVGINGTSGSLIGGFNMYANALGDFSDRNFVKEKRKERNDLELEHSGSAPATPPDMSDSSEDEEPLKINLKSPILVPSDQEDERIVISSPRKSQNSASWSSDTQSHLDKQFAKHINHSRNPINKNSYWDFRG